MLRLLFAAALGLAAAQTCQDDFDWSPGAHLPYDDNILHGSISRMGDVRRLRPLLEKLSSKRTPVTVLIIGASAVEDPSQLHPWSDVFCDWLHRTFPARITTSRLYLTGVLSEYLKVIPSSAALVKPDLVLVEISLSPLVRASKFNDIDQTPQYIVVEDFMRAMLQLPGDPAVVWVDLMPDSEELKTNEDTNSIMSAYYKIPHVSVHSAWKNRLPFPPKELWQGKHLTLTGHKLIAVTLGNFMCYEFLQTCLTTTAADSMMPKALFSESLTAEEQPAVVEVGQSTGDGALDVAFCRRGTEVTKTAEKSSEERLAWSLAITLALLPPTLLQVFACFFGPSGKYLQNRLPQSLPELEFLRVVATVNIVAWQFFQELPPAWSQPGNAISKVCHQPYYDYPKWDRTTKNDCMDALSCTWCKSGKYCFQFFFLLQAFVSTLNTVRTGPVRPIWQYAQVWPIHALAILLAIAASAPVNPLDLGLVATLTHAWISPFYSQLNGASWYLSSLVGFWIVLPIWTQAADALAGSRGVSGVVAALTGAWLCTLQLPFLLFVWPVSFGLREVDPSMVIHNFVAYSPYTNWQPVAIGMLLAVLVMMGIEPRTKVSVAICLALPLLGLSIVWFALPSPGFTMGEDYLLLEKGFALQPLFALLLLGSVGARHVPNKLHQALTGKTMLMFARLCWPVFILHQPVHRVCLQLLFPQVERLHPPPIVYMILYPAVLLLLSQLASRFIDKPWTGFVFRYRNSDANASSRRPPLVYEKVDVQQNGRPSKTTSNNSSTRSRSPKGFPP